VITVEDLGDEDGDAAREHFAALQAKAAAVGLTLTRSPHGFLLVTKTHSRHAGDLKTIAGLLVSKAARRK
jgi:hypothetical protein